MLSISLVKDAKILMTRSLPMTSEMLRSPESPDEPSLSLSFDGGKRTLGMFMIGDCPLSKAGFAGELLERKKPGRTISWDAAVDVWRLRVSNMTGAENFMAYRLKCGRLMKAAFP